MNLVVKTAKKPRTGVIENVATLQAAIASVDGSPATATTTLVKK